MILELYDFDDTAILENCMAVTYKIYHANEPLSLPGCVRARVLHRSGWSCSVPSGLCVQLSFVVASLERPAVCRCCHRGR